MEKKKDLVKSFPGIPIGDGFSHGKVVFLDHIDFWDSEMITDPQLTFFKNKLKFSSCKNSILEIRTLDLAVKKSSQDLIYLIQVLKKKKKLTKKDKTNLDIFNAHLEILNDEELIDEFKETIKNKNYNATKTIFEVISKYIEQLSKLSSEYLKQRITDYKDVWGRVIKHLNNQTITYLVFTEKENIVIVTKDLFPATILAFDKEIIKGVILEKGSYTSHASIILKNIGIPCFINVKNAFNLPTEKIVLLDLESKKIFYKFNNSFFLKFLTSEKKYLSKLEFLEKYKNKPTLTRDGTKISLCLNYSSPKQLETINDFDYDGIGLFRTEFLFLNRNVVPSFEEQQVLYENIVKATFPKEVIFRTIDIGGDKKSAIFNLKEANPFLGFRGIRVCLKKKELFKDQIKALLLTTKLGKVSIMFPMISNIEEVQECIRIIEECKKELKVKKENNFSNFYRVGIMIEVPSAALLIKNFAKYVDFFSIGTNDLIQYLLAVDRTNSMVLELYQTFHPAVIRLVYKVIKDSYKYGKEISICGEMASEKIIIPLLLAMGLRKLSVNLKSFLNIKRIISLLNLKKLNEVLDMSLSFEKASDLENYLFNFYKKNLD